jgi:uncharacterized protein
MTHYLLIFVAGFAGSFHCLGMCGGFACAVGRDPAGRHTLLARQLLYNTGRLATYGFLGLLAGMLGESLIGHGDAGTLGLAQRLLAVTAGLLMMVMALQLWGRPAGLQRMLTGFGVPAFAGSLRALLSAPARSAPLAFGVFNGFLPCPLVYAFAAQAAASASVPAAMLTMIAFGLGTYPAMLLAGGLGQRLGPALRRRGMWVAGGFLLALGLVTLARGLWPSAGHLHLAP